MAESAARVELKIACSCDKGVSISQRASARRRGLLRRPMTGSGFRHPASDRYQRPSREIILRSSDSAGTLESQVASLSLSEAILSVPKPIVFKGTFEDYKQNARKIRRFSTLTSFARAVEAEEDTAMTQAMTALFSDVRAIDAGSDAADEKLTNLVLVAKELERSTSSTAGLRELQVPKPCVYEGSFQEFRQEGKHFSRFSTLSSWSKACSESSESSEVEAEEGEEEQDEEEVEETLVNLVDRARALEASMKKELEEEPLVNLVDVVRALEASMNRSGESEKVKSLARPPVASPCVYEGSFQEYKEGSRKLSRWSTLRTLAKASFEVIAPAPTVAPEAAMDLDLKSGSSEGKHQLPVFMDFSLSSGIAPCQLIALAMPPSLATGCAFLSLSSDPLPKSAPVKQSPSDSMAPALAGRPSNAVRGLKRAGSQQRTPKPASVAGAHNKWAPADATVTSTPQAAADRDSSITRLKGMFGSATHSYDVALSTSKKSGSQWDVPGLGFIQLAEGRTSVSAKLPTATSKPASKMSGFLPKLPGGASAESVALSRQLLTGSSRAPWDVAPMF